MAEYLDREAFIPLSRQDLLTLCLQEDGLQEDGQAQAFANFCQLLDAYLHFRYHETLESLKGNFAHLDPDRDTVPIGTVSEAEAQAREQALEERFVHVLQRANYQPLEQEQILAAMAEASLIPLEMKIDFADFAQYQFYWRGATTLTIPLEGWWQKLWQRQHEMEVFKRVVLLLRFREAEYFQQQGLDPDKLRFTPGKMYLYLYKMIPRHDLEVLFPNVQIQMSWKDRLMFVIPALGAAVPMLLKALPQLLLILGVLLFFIFGPSTARHMGVSDQQIHNFLPVLAALLSLGLLFGSFAFKQYLNYKNKRLKFMKDVTDTLFFRNLVSNAGVFHALVDSAEEEEAKEAMLVMHLLLQAEQPLSAAELDDRIEHWLEQQGLEVDFDIHKVLETLSGIRTESASLLQRDASGRYQVLSLEAACTLLDEIWDHLFTYYSASSEDADGAFLPKKS